MKEKERNAETWVLESRNYKNEKGTQMSALLTVSGPFARIYFRGRPEDYGWMCLEYPLGLIRDALGMYDSILEDIEGEGGPLLPSALAERVPFMVARENGIMENGTLLYFEDPALGEGKELSTLEAAELSYFDWEPRPWERESQEADPCPFPCAERREWEGDPSPFPRKRRWKA